MHAFHQSWLVTIHLMVYVDDIVFTDNDHHDISQMKQHLCHYFQTKDLGKIKYLLGLRWHNPTTVLLNLKGSMNLIFWRKLDWWTQNLLTHPWSQYQTLLLNHREPLSDPDTYKRLVGKLNYLTVISPDNFIAICVVSLFLNS